MAKEKKTLILEKKDNVKEFAKLIKQTREKKDLSLRDVEKATGISYSYLSQLESAKRGIPQFNILSTLFSYYGIPYETIYKFYNAKGIRISEEGPDIEVVEGSNNPLQKKMLAGFDSLTFDGRKKLLEYMDFLLAKER